MMRSMFSGVAGLKTHQVKMDVIGNNIANVNTTSYKSQSIVFSDLLYQNSQRASGASANVGGTNARQIGLGAKSGAINTAITSQGATQTTNNPFDIMITGDSFFVVNDGTGNQFTRDGSFYLDGQGNLCMQSTGYYVQGWTAIEDPAAVGGYSVNQNAGIGMLQVMSDENSQYGAEATTAGTFTGNIDANDTNVTSDLGKIVTMEFYDNRGYLYTAKFNIQTVKDGAGNNQTGQYTLSLTDVIDSVTNESIVGDGENINQYFTMHYLSEPDPNGNRTSAGPAQVAQDSQGNDWQQVHLTYSPQNGSWGGVVYTGNGQGTATTNLFDHIRLVPHNGNDFNGTANPTKGLKADGTMGTESFDVIDFDLSTTTNVNTNESSTIRASKGDLQKNGTGRMVGEMNGISVEKNGRITATYTNGQSKLIGQIATAQFANASGLEKTGDNLYSATMNSGDPIIQDITTDGGYMNTGVLEMSNVDLSSEFTEMITTQRGFQANSRIITVSDTMLEELTNLKR